MKINKNINSKKCFRNKKRKYRKNFSKKKGGGFETQLGEATIGMIGEAGDVLKSGVVDIVSGVGNAGKDELVKVVSNPEIIKGVSNLGTYLGQGVVQNLPSFGKAAVGVGLLGLVFGTAAMYGKEVKGGINAVGRVSTNGIKDLKKKIFNSKGDIKLTPKEFKSLVLAEKMFAEASNNIRIITNNPSCDKSLDNIVFKKDVGPIVGEIYKKINTIDRKIGLNSDTSPEVITKLEEHDKSIKEIKKQMREEISSYLQELMDNGVIDREKLENLRKKNSQDLEEPLNQLGNNYFPV